MRIIRALADYIVQRFQPEAIILFGSYAYGKPQPWSDVDLLIVMDTPRGEAETALEVYRSLPPITFSLDLIVRSRETIERRKKLKDWFLIDITEKGKILYERNHP
ncbi:MAG: nucleotidyltransferase domain-containing protein [Chloroflexota bacterium]